MFEIWFETGLKMIRNLIFVENLKLLVFFTREIRLMFMYFSQLNARYVTEFILYILVKFKITNLPLSSMLHMYHRV